MKLAALALCLLGLGPTTTALSTWACPEPEAPRIAVFFWHDAPNDMEALAGLRRGLEICGWTIAVEIHADRDEALARRELATLPGRDVDLLVAFGTRSAQLAGELLDELPIVFTAVTNPVLSGISPSWQGSGRNVAGNSNWLDRRRMLDVFEQGVPRMKRLGILRSPENAVSRAELEEARAALRADEDLEIVEFQVDDAGRIDEVLDQALPQVDAIWLPIDFDLYQREPLELLVKRTRAARKPLLSSAAKAAGAGAMLTLTVDYELLGMKAAALVRRVVDGEKPEGMVIERLRSTRLHVDLVAARAIGLELPVDLLLGAHRIVGTEATR